MDAETLDSIDSLILNGTLAGLTIYQTTQGQPTVTTYATPAGAVTTGISTASFLPWLLIGGLALVVLLEKK